jgi:uncharacterized damage-inducible protein DinB
MNLNDIRKLFDYTEWANHLMLDAVQELTEEQRRHDFKISHGSIYGTIAHMAGAEWIWLERWHGISHSFIWKDVDFPQFSTLDTRWREIEARRRDFLNGLSEEEVQADLSYKNIKGEPFTLPLISQMQHVVNHATLHRGQVVGLIRQLGAQPPAVDLLYYLISQK